MTLALSSSLSPQKVCMHRVNPSALYAHKEVKSRPDLTVIAPS